MMPTKTTHQSGFSLLEIIIAIAITLVITIAGVSALNKVQELSSVIAQRSDMQLNARSAFNYLASDISLAGTGLPFGGVALPVVGVNPPTYGSLFSTCCTAFRNDSNGNPFLYAAEGGWSYPPHLGSIDHLPQPLITVSYLDTDVSTEGGLASASCGPPPVPPMVLDQFWPSLVAPFTKSATVTDVAQGVKIKFNDCVDITDPTDPSNALKIGDALLVCATNCAVGIITDLPGGNAVLLKSGDALHLNQPTVALGNIQAMRVAGNYPAIISATRIKIVTYFLDPDAGVDGIKGTSDDGPPFRLMRRVNAGNPVVLAENILDLQVSYDLYDDSSASQTAGEQNPLNIVPNLIRNVNLFVTVRSPMPNAKGAYQGMSLATSVSPRNLSYHNRYQ